MLQHFSVTKKATDLRANVVHCRKIFPCVQLGSNKRGLVCCSTGSGKIVRTVLVHTSTYWYMTVLLTHPGIVFSVKYNSVQLLCEGYNLMMSNSQNVVLVRTGTYWYRNTLQLNHTLSSFRRRRVSSERLACSSRLASFFRAASSTVRPPRRGLPRPNCHSHGLTSYTLLPRLPSALILQQLCGHSP